ncbi:MAG TPA: hypothetical protein VJ998_12015, partial [Pseudomonadales bacterium]|nr:hypothetical protein [Pseudomonadales bacterium]
MSETTQAQTSIGFLRTTDGESQASKDPYSIPLEDIDLLRPDIFYNDTHLGYFERLRKEDPVHFSSLKFEGMEEPFAFWNITRYNDIKYVDTSHDIFSSEGSIVADDMDEEFPLPMFIAMDPPKHDMQRREVTSAVAPRNLANFEPIIRERTQSVLDALPIGKEFNWVQEVSIELTTRMLATLFDFPFEDRAKLTRWSDVATAAEGVVEDEDQRRAELVECLEYFTRLWNER